MLSDHVIRRSIPAAIVAILLVLSASSVANDGGVITLRLEEPGSTGRPSTDNTIIVPPSRKNPAPLPEVKGASAVLTDVDTGQVLYSKNPHVKRPNASTTKIMTAILLIEKCKMTDMIKASKKACEIPYTSLHLKPGEKISARDLLMGLMVRSANDAAVAAAEHIAGTTAKFANMMNAKAKAIGCKNTHLITPNGLHARGHYSTAYDVCLMAKYAFKYDIFNEAIKTTKHTLTSRTINKDDLVVFTKSKFLKEYPGADGVKSGYVKEAGYCFVGSATRNGWRLLSSVLKSDNAGRDTAAIMDYGFANFKPFMVARAGRTCSQAQVTGGAESTVAVAPVRDLKLVVPKTGAKITTRFDLEPAEAPIEKGARLGTVTVILNGNDVVTVDLRAVDEVGISLARKASPWLKTGGILVACLVVGGKYGAALTKNSRRRRRGVASILRDPDRYR